jgi:hypothetical protein
VIVRWSLALACAFNLLAAIVFAFPSSEAGRQLGLPADVSPLYAALVALFVALFGGAYGWLARRPAIDRPLLALGAIGKLGAFIVASCLWLAAAVPGVVVVLASGDLAFAGLWFHWLHATRRQAVT